MFNTPGSNIITTADGEHEVPMSPGDILVDEFGTTAVEFRGAGEWVALFRFSGERWLQAGTFVSGAAARHAAEGAWDGAFHEDKEARKG